MIRALLKLMILVVVLVAAGAFFLGYWGNNRLHPAERTGTVGTAGRIDTERAREAAATVGEKTAAAANKAGAMISDSALTAKIKSKMALDDSVRARTIDVTTVDHVVTLSGIVRSVPEHDRAVQLARETDGVTRVIDKLSVNVGRP
jgi:hyperosmotically inducible periplasmic protein